MFLEIKKEKIKELLAYIDERLDTLQVEMDELKQYQTLDKDRRSIEYTIHEKELQATRAKLEQVAFIRFENFLSVHNSFLSIIFQKNCSPTET